jgi:hypothetical protein
VGLVDGLGVRLRFVVLGKRPVDAGRAGGCWPLRLPVGMIRPRDGGSNVSQTAAAQAGGPAPESLQKSRTLLITDLASNCPGNLLSRSRSQRYGPRECMVRAQVTAWSDRRSQGDGRPGTVGPAPSALSVICELQGHVLR